MKHLQTLSFLDGALSVKRDGYGDQIGWGQFVWDENQVELVPHEETTGHSVVVEIPPSELIALRDFLLKLFPIEVASSPSIVR